MPFTSRLYGQPDDFARLKQFLIAAQRDAGLRGYLHVGDLIWRMYQNVIFDPTQNIRLYFDTPGELSGFAWFYPLKALKAVELQIQPRLRGNGELETEMLAWANEYHQTFFKAGETPTPLLSNSPAYDGALENILARAGFVKTEKFSWLMEQTLDHAIPETRLPNGYRVHHVAQADEFEERVSIHREVWHPSRVTLDGYRRMRTIDGYLPELDLVVETSEKIFAAYCICWFDPINRSGEFEPVGTRPAFRRQGLGKVILLEGLRRLQTMGAQKVIVYCEDDNRPFYESVGFRAVYRDYEWEKPVDSRQ